MAGQGRKSKKVERAEKKSNNVAASYVNALKKGKPTHVVLGKVTKVNGDGRFKVQVGREEISAHVSKTLFSKGAKHRNATMKTAVHTGSYVLIDGDIIRSVVGAANAANIKRLTRANSAKSKNSSKSNNFFNRAGGSRKARSTRKVRR